MGQSESAGNNPEKSAAARAGAEDHLLEAVVRHAKLAGVIVAGLLLLCVVYCVLAPRQYDAVARVELRSSPLSALRLDGAEPVLSASIFSAPTAQETTASILRGDQLAWDVIRSLALYKAAGFKGGFETQFAHFDPAAPTPAERGWLVERFHRKLRVQPVPRTLLIEIRFRSLDPVLSAQVVGVLLACYAQEENARRTEATSQSSVWLNSKLTALEASASGDEQRLSAFREQHGFLRMPSSGTGQNQGEGEHNAALVEIDELGRQLVTATSDRILAEAEFHAASEGDPELVAASDPRLQAASGDFSVAVLEQIHARRSDLEQERAQLSAEHGASFPRVVEIDRQLSDLAAQQRTEDARLVDRFHRALLTALAREQSVRHSLDEATAEGMKLNRAATEYERMQQQADSSHDLLVRVKQKTAEAGLSAAVGTSTLSVVDPPFPPAKPSSPNTGLLVSITLFVALWLAAAAVLVAERLPRLARRIAAAAALLLIGFAGVHAQAPTPSTSGLPAGVAHIAPTQDNRVQPDPRQASGQAPAQWNASASPAAAQQQGSQLGVPMAAPIGPNDALDISEYHTPEFRSAVRVSAAGTVTLPLIGEIRLAGMDEHEAARAIEAALVSKGMLLHPVVSVLVTAYAGQDVSVLGEVTRPGVYPYTAHHRLLDLISASAGLGPSAGRLVNIYHRDDPRTPHPVVLDPSGTDTAGDHNPELVPGDTVQVSRAGVVYVIGDLIRPGGFPMDPAQGLTVVQALSLAWGPSENAATTHAILIREQQGGRTLTALNLHRMLHGQEPDQPMRDRDILFVPDSTAHNLWNRSIESAIQSLVGVSIYSGLVYSQRY